MFSTKIVLFMLLTSSYNHKTRLSGFLFYSSLTLPLLDVFFRSILLFSLYSMLSSKQLVLFCYLPLMIEPFVINPQRNSFEKYKRAASHRSVFIIGWVILRLRGK
jgi:hypothetical protein